jgi:uncharacterized protein (DUF488 family)
MEKIIYTLGTSNRSLEEFLEILRFYQISQVIDVRRWPTSRWFEHFKKENLKEILKKNKIKYFHFEKLGGFREGGYENYLKTKEFQEVLEKLIKLTTTKKIKKKKKKKKHSNILKNVRISSKTLLICAERLPWKCHRLFIAQELKKRGFQVIHIIEREKFWQPEKEPQKIKLFCEKKL